MTTKINALVDAIGNPIAIVLTPGQAHDLKAAPALLAEVAPGAVIADKAYDSDGLIEPMVAAGVTPVIPPKSNGDAMTGTLEATELLDVDVDQLAGRLALVAPYGFRRLQRGDTVEAELAKHAADGRRGHGEITGDLLAGKALPPLGFDGGDRFRWRRLAQSMRP